MKQLNLLIVDDDPNQVQLISDKIREKNVELKKNEMEIITYSMNSGEEAIINVTNNDYDAAIVDLKLSGDKKKIDGNDVIKEIKSKMRFPIFVLSDFPQDIAPELEKETEVFKIKERSTTDLGALIDEIIYLYKSGITELFGPNGNLEKYITDAIAELFWERIAVNWKYIVERIPEQASRLKIICRQLNSILKEKMQLNELGFEKSEPFEMYMIPPIRSYFYTGDIITKNDSHFIILSPACDMEIRKENKPDVENVVIAKLSHIKDHYYTNACWNEGKFSNSDKNNAKVENLIKSSRSEFHLLPPFQNIAGFIIDFSDVQSIPYEDLKNYKRIATVTEPYLKNIVSRFSNHFNRLGQPDFDVEKLKQEIKTL